jgi:hypothetical protein
MDMYIVKQYDITHYIIYFNVFDFKWKVTVAKTLHKIFDRLRRIPTRVM